MASGGVLVLWAVMEVGSMLFVRKPKMANAVSDHFLGVDAFEILNHIVPSITKIAHLQLV